MGEALNGLKRTHHCGDLRSNHIDETITLMGWVQKRRNLGGLIFVDLRDRSGLCQIVFDTDVDQAAFEKAEALRNEFCIAVTGKVYKRHSVNDQMATGQVEIFVEKLVILNESEVPPIHVDDNDAAGERLRLKYRYLDLRKPKMQAKMMMRNKVGNLIRNYLENEGFCDIETPVLTKPTPEGARDYLVPSRVHPGKFYALPQSPQLFKQMLMVSGMERYYQIVKCFRDEDLRADRQPEFTQVDIEMSFVEEDDVMGLNEKMIQHIFKETVDFDVQLPLKRLCYDEAMTRFGSDKPDLRVGFELKSLNDVLANSEFKVFSSTLSNGGDIRAINVNGFADQFTRKNITQLEEHAKTYGAKGLAWIKVTDEGVTSPIAKFLSEEELAAILERLEAKANDLLLFVADKPQVVFDALGALRLEVAKRLNLFEGKPYEMLWVTDFPVFEYDEEDGRYYAKHHPFTAPKDGDEDLLLSEPGKCYAKAYDMVINGYEVGGGSIRIHTSDIQEKMFKALGLDDQEVEEKFGFLIEAFKYGTPPHGGIAFGLDRLIMLLTGTDNIKEVIAFPKTQDAKCLLTEAPSIADEKQLREELFITHVGVDNE